MEAPERRAPLNAPEHNAAVLYAHIRSNGQIKHAEGCARGHRLGESPCGVFNALEDKGLEVRYSEESNRPYDGAKDNGENNK